MTYSKLVPYPLDNAQ